MLAFLTLPSRPIRVIISRVSSKGSAYCEAGDKVKIKCIGSYKLDSNTSGSLQIFYNNNLKAKYARLRVYKGLDSITKKPKFDYVKVSITSEIQDLLKTKISYDQSRVGQSLAKTNIEQNFKNQGLNENQGGRRLVWFRTLAFQANDPGFKSRRPHHYPNF